MPYFILFIIGLFAAGAAAAADFPDVDGHKYEQYILRLQAAKVIEGNPDGTFTPEREVNRAEFVKMLTLAADKPLTDKEDLECFEDFTGEEQWYWQYACSAKELDFVDGHPDGTFRGETTVNLAEAVKMAVEAWNLPLPRYVKEPDNWYDPYLDTAAGTGLFTELPNKPDRLLTRAETAVVLTRLDPAYEPDVSDDDRLSESAVPLTPEPSFTYTPPVYHGALRLEQRPLATVSATAGRKDILLLEFDAVAARQDVLLTRVKFEADEGSLDNAVNYKLYYDADNDGSAETLISNAVPQADILVFTNLNVRVPVDQMIRLALRGDVRQSGNPESFSVKFATDELDYVEGADAVDGADVTGIETDSGDCPIVSVCWIAVRTQDSRLVSIAGSPGNLYVTKDATPVRNHQLLLGTLTDVLLRLEFTAVNERVKITKLRLGGGTASIDSLQLYRFGESIPFAVARQSDCEAVVSGLFCADTELSVGKDDEIEVLVRAKLKSDDAGGSTGETAALALSGLTTGYGVAIEAEGEATLQTLDQNDGDAVAKGEIFIGRTTPGHNIAIVGPTHDLVAAKIISISNSHPDPDETPVPVGVTDFATFTFKAAAHNNKKNGLNNAVIEDITFNVNANNVKLAASSIKLFNPADSSTTINCSQSATTGVISVTCSSLGDGGIQSVIPEGEAVEFSLRGEITNPQVSNGSSTLQASIEGLGVRNTGPIRWNDEVAVWLWVDTEQSTVKSTLYKQ